jgi:hypothetical protein
MVTRHNVGLRFDLPFCIYLKNGSYDISIGKRTTRVIARKVWRSPHTGSDEDSVAEQTMYFKDGSYTSGPMGKDPDAARAGVGHNVEMLDDPRGRFRFTRVEVWLEHPNPNRAKAERMLAEALGAINRLMDVYRFVADAPYVPPVVLTDIDFFEVVVPSTGEIRYASIAGEHDHVPHEDPQGEHFREAHIHDHAHRDRGPRRRRRPRAAREGAAGGPGEDLLGLAAHVRGRAHLGVLPRRNWHLRIPGPVAVMGVALFALGLTTVTSNTASAAMLVPLAIPLAGIIGVDPVLLVVVVAVASSVDFALVIGTPPTMLAYATRLFTTREIFRTGIVLDVLGIAILTGVAVWIWQLLGVV